jgi:mannosyltransferase OCH1-like enzyme
MVPKIIHRIVGRKPSPLVTHCMNSWEIIKDYGFEIRIWNDALLEKFIAQEYPSVLSAFTTARNYGEASDIARYLIVYHFGGYYFDWDTELLNINKFLELPVQNPSGFLIQDPVNKTLAPDAFSAIAGEKFLYNLLENICYIHENGFRDSLKTIDYTGPYRMREVYYFTKKNSQQNLIKPKDILLYDYWEIRDQPFRDEEVAIIHYWEHGWMKTQPQLSVAE